MKKARILAFLMTVALTTTSFISGTVAKYTTSDATGDSAQVAKWGVELSVDGTLFGKNYEDYDENSDTSNHPTASTTDSEFSVKSESEANLVAPGTQNDTGITVSLTGKTEVRTKVTMEISYQNVCLPKGNYYMLTEIADATDDMLTAAKNAGLKIWEAVTTGGNTTYTEMGDTLTVASGNKYYTSSATSVNVDAAYYPIAYKLSQDNATAAVVTEEGKDDYKLYDSLETLVNKLFNDFKSNDNTVTPTESEANGVTTVTAERIFAPNVDLTALNLDDVQITWEWVYEDVDTDTADPSTEDIKDTFLGTLANLDANAVYLVVDDASTTANAAVLNTSFNIEITVEQVD